MKKLEIEGLNNEASNEANENEQENNIEFSSKLVQYFSQRVKAFKKDNKASLTVDHLKKVYCHGARLAAGAEARDLNPYALAWVHMFLRLKAGDKMASKKNSPDSIKATKLELEEPKKSIRLSSFIDISESWAPNGDDFKKAEKEMEENDLKHEYDNIEDLYLEYEPIDQKWD